MASAISNWYNNQHGGWGRAQRVLMPPFLGHANRAMNGGGQGPAIVNMEDFLAEMPSKKSQDTLFGPAIGTATVGPDWTISDQPQNSSDDLTPDIVKTWIEKSKDPTQPTTTLQALVNLKRPSLRLSPLTDDPLHHGVEFQYDCDAPKCSIQIHVMTSAAPSAESASLLVFETVVDGGFGKALKLEDDATLELSKFEEQDDEPSHANHSHAAINTASPDDPTPAAVPSSESSASVPAVPSAHPRKRFSAFPFRKRAQNRNSPNVTAGPALQVVDEASVPSEANTVSHKKEEGVKVTIRLEALDDKEQPLRSPNTQVTYLHVVRLGQRQGSEAAHDEDIRPWVVKVVKREATIGPHTFHLHEIYGLTTSAAAPPAHSYPPSSTEQQAQAYDFAGQECVLCLSSPREVVLLPCRHLVACKECAVNMVEFGAGGTLNQPTANDVQATPVAAAAGSEDSPQTEDVEHAGADIASAAEHEIPEVPAASTNTPAAVVAPVPSAVPRRKRKPKGWFCPVCRQPYTALLRITTTPPDMKTMRDSEDEPADSITSADHENVGGTPMTTPRPSFLRSFSRATRAVPASTAPAEVGITVV